MASYNADTFYRTPASSATQNIPRYVEDVVRDMWPESAKLLAFVADGEVVGGQMTEKAGMIAKKEVDNPRVECYSYAPLGMTVTVMAGGNGTTTFVVSTTDSYQIVAPYCVVNLTNFTTARIDSISTVTATVTSFGSSSFTTSTGDVLLILSPAYGEASVDPVALWKDEDNLYNITQICRFPIKISATAKATPSYFGDYFSRMHKVGFIEAKRKVDASLIMSNRPSSGNTTSGGSAFSTAFGTTRGVWNWSVASSFDCGGKMTLDTLRVDIPNYYVSATANNVGEQSPMVMFCGNAVGGKLMQMVNVNQHITQVGGDVEVFGLKAKEYQTSTFSIKVVTHSIFNYGNLATSALLFNTDELFYAFLKGRDLQPQTNIQSPSMDGFEDELKGELTIGVRDGGNSVLQITNIY